MIAARIDLPANDVKISRIGGYYHPQLAGSPGLSARMRKN